MAGATAPVNAGYIAPQVLKLIEAGNYASVLKFARAAGVNSSTLYSTINADRTAKLKTALRICDANQVSMDWLLGLTDQQEPARGTYRTSPDEATALKIFGGRLRKAMARSGLDAETLARKICIDESTVRHHMRGGQGLRTDTLAYYASGLHVSADWLLGRTDSGK